MRIPIYIVSLFLRFASGEGWAADIDETATFLIKVGATKYEIARGIKEMLDNRRWTEHFNFVVIVFKKPDDKSGSTYFSCDKKATSTQVSPLGGKMRVFVMQGINRHLPMTDRVVFNWIATHPTESLINDAGGPGKNIFASDGSCHNETAAEDVWRTYLMATKRFPELKNDAGQWMTVCGWDGPPTEEIKGELDIENTADYAVLVATKQSSFFNRYLLDDRPQVYKDKNRLAVQAHPDWCTKNCTATSIDCDFNPAKNCIDNVGTVDEPLSTKFDSQMHFDMLGWSTCCITLGLLPDQNG